MSNRQGQLLFATLILVAWVLTARRPATGTTAPASTGAEQASVREGPKLLTAAEARVGSMIRDVAFTDLAGKAAHLTDFRGHKATVFCMTATGCPVAKKYTATIVGLANAYHARGVEFVLVNPDAHADAGALQSAFAAIHASGFAGRYVHDASGALTRALGVTSSTEAVLLDGALTIEYRGAIDDQYGLGYALPQPRKRYLSEALDAVLIGQTPLIAATTAPGCALEPHEKDAEHAANITFHNRVSRIMQQHCQSCHRPGEAAPFSLIAYGEVKDHLGMIKKVLSRGTMPPWFADPKLGHWANDRTLPERDKGDLIAWATAGAPVGDPKDAPLPRTFAQGWKIGKPDAIFQPSTPVHIPANGPIPYRNVIVTTNLAEDKWIRAVEIRTPNPQIVHHLLVFLSYPPGDVRAKDQPDVRGGVGGYFAALVPGQAATIYPSDGGKLLPKGATLRMQIHYTPDGTAVDDLPKIGFLFADKKPEHQLITQAASNVRFRIPPGAENYEVKATHPFQSATRILSFMPHSHVRCTAYRYEIVYPDGHAQPLLNIPRYDFNWQLEYQFAEPIDVPEGASLRVQAWFDNSAKNPANPDPTKTVRFGEQTSEEMMIGYFTGYRLP